MCMSMELHMKHSIWELTDMLTWDSGIVGNSLTCCATIMTPENSFISLDFSISLQLSKKFGELSMILGMRPLGFFLIVRGM